MYIAPDGNDTTIFYCGDAQLGSDGSSTITEIKIVEEKVPEHK